MSEENISFEELLKQLQNMVSQLETEDLGLEASLRLYEEGVRLSLKIVNLDGAEAKVVEYKNSCMRSLNECFGIEAVASRCFELAAKEEVERWSTEATKLQKLGICFLGGGKRVRPVLH